MSTEQEQKIAERNIPGRTSHAQRFAEVEHAENIGATLKRIALYFIQEKGTVMSLLAVVVLGTVFGIYAPSLQSNSIDIIAGEREGHLLYTLLFMLIVYLLFSVSGLVQGLLSARLSQNVVKRMREELFAKIIDLPIRYLDTHSHGDVMSRMTNDIENISTTVSQALPTLFAGRNLTSLSVATIMMNSIAALLTEYIVKSYFQRPGASNTETVVVNEGSILPRIFPSTQFNYGILVALFCVVVVTWMLYKTPFGFSLRAMGSNPRAMQQAGLPIYGRTIAAMCISGGLFALGGSIQCLAVYKRFVMGFSPGYGWDGITVATLAMNSPVGVLLSAFLFGMLRSASISMSLTSQVTTEMISVLQGFIVMLVASPDVWNVLGHLWQRLKSCVGRGRKQEGATE